MSDNTGRYITVVLKITKPEYPQWVLDSHLNKKMKLDLGARVVAIREGNSIIELERALEEIEENDLDDDMLEL